MGQTRGRSRREHDLTFWRCLMHMQPRRWLLLLMPTIFPVSNPFASRAPIAEPAAPTFSTVFPSVCFPPHRHAGSANRQPQWRVDPQRWVQHTRNRVSPNPRYLYQPALLQRLSHHHHLGAMRKGMSHGSTPYYARILLR
ncbi:hypothetical protein BJX63DRAFT_217864 [Aspergillus granulosus]|uniref:Secreted protein n=1 Tax=Aspergillus granulosus TaxID=176169 RepID=A0ABR4I2E1_9EURO